MNSTVIHERPGVYSSYDASTVISGGGAKKTVGLVARAAKGERGKMVSLTSYAAGLAAFGEDTEASAMAGLLQMLYRNGAALVLAVPVAENADTEAYTQAFSLLEKEDVGVMLCDSEVLAVQQALKKSVEQASAARRERIAVVSLGESAVSAMTARAKELNTERMVLVDGCGIDEAGQTVGGAVCAAALAGAIAASADPALPLNGLPLRGLAGLNTLRSDEEIDLLVRGGVTPLDAAAGVVSAVRGITTRTTTGSAPDTTWRELSTVLIVDDVIPAIRNALRRKFTRTKNTGQTRSAIRSQVIVELEAKRSAEIIESFGEVAVRASATEPTACEVEFSFAVAHGLNQIYLTAHITV